MLFSANKSENEINGAVLDAADILQRTLAVYIALTIGDGLIKRHGTTAIIAIPFATNAILFGKPISTVTIKLGSSNNSAKTPTKPLSVGHVPTSTSARSSKRKNSKN